MTSKGALLPSQAVCRPEAGPSDNTQHDEEHHEISNPPPYSAPSTPSGPLPARTSPYRGLPALNYTLYSPPNFKLSSDENTITTNKPEPNIYPTVLTSLLQSQATIPPKAQIHVKGISASSIVDFHIKLNMMTFFVGDNDPKQRWNYLKVVDDGELAWRGDVKMTTEPKLPGGINEWVRRYCADTSSIKQFTLERVVANWDTQYIEGRLHSMIANCGYRGQVEITFPTTHATVVVHSPDKVNRLFTDITHLFTGTKKYAVVKAVWPYASAPPESGDRAFAVLSEEAWWNDWKDAIRYAVLSRRKGWVTVEDQLESLMSPRRQITSPW